MHIHDVTITVGGEVRSERTIDPATVAREALAVVETWIGEAERVRKPAPCPARGLEHLSLLWTETAEGVAVATLSARGAGLTTSLLLRATAADADARKARDGLQRLQRRLAAPLGVEVGYDWHADDRRPLIQSMLHPSAAAAAPDDLAMIADIETCLAAAWLR